MVDPTARFSSFSTPLFLVGAMTDSDLSNLMFRLILTDTRFAVRICRGKKMKHTGALFDEFAAAFQFPYYFGENWPAFDECLADLSWLPADAYLLCLSSAEQICSEGAIGSFDVLIRILNDVALGWAGSDPNLATMERKPAPFHILMQVPREGQKAMIDRLAALNVSVGSFEY